MSLYMNWADCGTYVQIRVETKPWKIQVCSLTLALTILHRSAWVDFETIMLSALESLVVVSCSVEQCEGDRSFSTSKVLASGLQNPADDAAGALALRLAPQMHLTKA